MTDEEAAFALARIGPASGLGELARMDLVVEAIPEDLAMKRDAFHQLDAAAPEDDDPGHQHQLPLDRPDRGRGAEPGARARACTSSTPCR